LSVRWTVVVDVTLSPGPSPRERGDVGGVTGVTDVGSTTEDDFGVGELTKVYWSVPEVSAQAILGYAKKMRSAPTPAEKALWARVRANQLGYKVYRQRPMGYAIADFVFFEKRLIVEVDGGYHETPEMYWSDEERTRKFEAVGYSVIRFTNEEVLAAPFEVAAKIKAVLDSRQDRPFPYPTEVYLGTPTPEPTSGTPPTSATLPIPPTPASPATPPLSPGEGPGERVVPSPGSYRIPQKPQPKPNPGWYNRY